MAANCPECDAKVPLTDDVQTSEALACPECGESLEVASIDPVVLTLAPPQDEDWGE